MDPIHQRTQDATKAEKDAERHFAVFRGFALHARKFPDAESAVLFAQRSARAAREHREVSHVNGHGRLVEILATVSPSGQVDLTWRGAELISCNPPARKAKR